jgi:hypothetical protein
VSYSRFFYIPNPIFLPVIPNLCINITGIELGPSQIHFSHAITPKGSRSDTPLPNQTLKYRSYAVESLGQALSFWMITLRIVQLAVQFGTAIYQEIYLTFCEGTNQIPSGRTWQYTAFVVLTACPAQNCYS